MEKENTSIWQKLKSKMPFSGKKETEKENTQEKTDLVDLGDPSLEKKVETDIDADHSVEEINIFDSVIIEATQQEKEKKNTEIEEDQNKPEEVKQIGNRLPVRTSDKLWVHLHSLYNRI